jgi:transmembrane sensor
MDEQDSSVDHMAIQDEALSWLLKKDSANWTSRDREELDAWLAGSTAHRVAWLRLEAGWEGARRLKAFATAETSGTVPPLGAWRRSPYFDQVRSAPGAEDRARVSVFYRHSGRIAAALVLFTLGILGIVRFHASPDRYSTPVGGMASVPLADGSKLTLNTHTEIRVNLTADERHIELERGEAFFEVAKDPQRPFVVSAGRKRIIAVGTQFSVSRNADDVRVVVTEGVVRIVGESEPLRPQSERGGVALPAGGIARAHDQSLLLMQAPLPKAEEILSWRQGYLSFSDTPLAEAVAEFNRYNVHQMSVGDSVAASMRISGLFRPTNYDAFVRLLQDGYTLKARTSGEITVLTSE